MRNFSSTHVTQSGNTSIIGGMTFVHEGSFPYWGIARKDNIAVVYLDDNGYGGSTTRTMQFPAGKVLKEVEFYFGWGSVFSLSSAGNPTVNLPFHAANIQTVQTNWTVASPTVTLTMTVPDGMGPNWESMWNNGIYSFTYGNADGSTDTVVPTTTAVPTTTGPTEPTTPIDTGN